MMPGVIAAGVPVLSVHGMSIAPTFWIASGRLTTTLLRPSSTGPSSASGERPPGARPPEVKTVLTTRPTPLHDEAFRLLGLNPACTQ